MREKPAEAKEVLRRRLITTRQGVPLETRREWSRAICRRVCESDAFGRATHVVAYLPVGAEVDPDEAAVAALETGRELYYPVSGGAPEVRRSETVAAAVTPPTGEDEVLTLNTPQVLFLVPGVGFDDSGGRLGRGRGWYDHLLSRFDRASRWGLAFSLQLVPHLPLDPWDVRMNAVVTERGRIDPPRSPRLPEGTA
jgi:5-formyltetrahydrofolate cyclo-ligase